jgi:hypothetical protein
MKRYKVNRIYPTFSNNKSHSNDNRQNNKNNYYNSRNLFYKRGEVINHGERLFQKGIKLQEEIKRRNEEIKREKEIQESNICTFKPYISDVSIQLLKNRIERSPYNDEYILRYNSYLEEKQRKLQEKYPKQDDYMFTPIINKRSNHIAEDRIKNGIIMNSDTINAVSLSPRVLTRKRIEDLYEESKIKNYKIEQMTRNWYSQYKFKPEINEITNKIINSSFYERQEILKKKIEERQKNINENLKEEKDNKTGQKLFVPRLISNLHKYNIHDNDENVLKHTSNIFQYMYSYAQKFNSNKMEKEKELNKIIKNYSETKHINEDSEQIFNKLKEESFKRIYKLLDSDEDNVISVFNMDLRKLPPTIIKILDPIFKELKEENETLTEREFVRACDHLYNVSLYLI